MYSLKTFCESPRYTILYISHTLSIVFMFIYLLYVQGPHFLSFIISRSKIGITKYNNYLFKIIFRVIL